MAQGEDPFRRRLPIDMLIPLTDPPPLTPPPAQFPSRVYTPLRGQRIPEGRGKQRLVADGVKSTITEGVTCLNLSAIG
jgi:hypothetical protein